MLRSFLKIALISALLSPLCQAEPLDGLALIRTSRDKACIQAQDGKQLKNGEVSKAEGLNIEVPKDSFASLALSNNMALIFADNTKAKILKFELLDEPQKKLSQESCPSVFEIDIESGTMFMSRAEPKAKSKFIVKTKLGNFEALGENLRVSANGKELLIYAHDAAVNYYPIDSSSPQYIGMGYFAKIKSENGKIKLTREKLASNKSVENLDLFGSAKDAWKSTYFDYTNPEKPVARRILSPNFWARQERVLPKN